MIESLGSLLGGGLIGDISQAGSNICLQSQLQSNQLISRAKPRRIISERMRHR